jgi:type II secretory pathway predicted ATPase ExeA
MATIKEWFKLKQNPFTRNMQHSELYRYEQIDELFALLKQTVEDSSMALVTGRAGTGKTTGVRGFLGSLPTAKYRSVYIGQEQRSSGVIVRILHELGAQTKGTWANRTLRLSQKLQDTIRSGRHLILVIDEAHLLESQTLEDIRLLTNTEMDSGTGLSVLILGQHWLRGMLKKVPNEALYQRLRLRIAMEGLTESQTRAYIQHHLSLAGAQQEVFSEEATTEIFAASEGILREINNIAYECMYLAAATEVHIIDKSLVQKVLDRRELN